MDRISSLGYALGYIGSTIPFITCMVIVVLATVGIVPFSVETAYKISFVITVIWWAAFSIPIIKNVIQRYGIDPEPHYIRKSFAKNCPYVKRNQTAQGDFHFPVGLFLLYRRCGYNYKNGDSLRKYNWYRKYYAVNYSPCNPVCRFSVCYYFTVRPQKNWNKKNTLLWYSYLLCDLCCGIFHVAGQG